MRTRTKTPTTKRNSSKEQRLRRALRDMGSVVVAFSGGVDSAYLAYVASAELGPRALAVTADSPSYPEHHRALATRLAAEVGFAHEFILTGEVDLPEYRANPANRCYYCKHELYGRLAALARDRRFAFVVDGSNADDRGDYRPGRAAARESGVRSPLDEVDLRKDEIRELALEAGLSVWDEPASACLSSRIPYFSEVTPDKLRMIERAENVLRSLGFRVMRVRHHDFNRGSAPDPGSSLAGAPAPRSGSSQARTCAPSAVIEIGRDEMARAFEPGINEAIVRELRAIGYEQVTIDPQGYRMGSLNEPLRLRPV